MSKIVVVGGAGYLGRPLCQRLAAAGHQVSVLDRGTFGLPPQMDDRIATVRSDVRLREVVREVVRGVDAVVHLGFVNGREAVAASHHVADSINVTATRWLVDEVLRAQVPKLIVCGDAYESLSDGPATPYGDQMADMERTFFDDAACGYEKTLLRLPLLFGFSTRMRFDLPINQMVAQAICDGTVVEPTRKAVVPHLHVADAVTALKMMLDAPVDPGVRALNVGGEGIDLRDVVGTLKKARADLRVVEGEVDLDTVEIDGSEFRTRTGFGRAVPFEDGIREVASFLIQQRGSLNWTDPVFHNRKMPL